MRAIMGSFPVAREFRERFFDVGYRPKKGSPRVKNSSFKT
jgi:hypothetical protein